MRVASLTVLLLSLALPAEAGAAFPWENGEPPIILGAGVEAPCSYCSTLSASVVGPVDGLALQATSSPLEKGYAVLLNAPCVKPEPGQPPCPQPLYSGTVQTGLSAGWFVPETDTFRVWALREGGTCQPHFTPPYSTASPGCTFNPEVCSAAQTVTLPASVDVTCSSSYAAKLGRRRASQRHLHHRRQCRTGGGPHPKAQAT